MNSYCLLVVAAGLAVPCMADTNQVVLYGQMNLGMESAKPQSQTAITRLVDYSSRIGFRGEEALDDGLRATWQVETGIRPDDASATAWASRDSFVGLAGGFGEVRLGRHDSPYKLVSGSLDLFGSRTASYSTLFHNQGAGWNNGLPKYDSRHSNMLGYWSPTWRGMQGLLMYVPDETKTSALNRQIWSGALKYNLAPVFLGVGYEQRADQNAAGESARGWQVVGSYEFPSAATLGAGYERISMGRLARPAWLVTASQPFGSLTLKAIYARAGGSGMADGKGGELDNGARQYSFGFDYALSKRTKLIGYYSHIDNRSQGSYDFTSNAVGANPLGTVGRDASVFAVGTMLKY